MRYRIVPLDLPTLASLAAGDLATASARCGTDLTPFIADEGWLWRLRLRQLESSPDDLEWIARPAVALDGPNRGETKQFLTVPLGAETCGPVVTDDLVTVCVQHPGESDDNSVDDPLSRWPEGGNGTARPSVVAVWRDAGNIGV